MLPGSRARSAQKSHALAIGIQVSIPC
jgi:hypothetical protein